MISILCDVFVNFILEFWSGQTGWVGLRQGQECEPVLKISWVLAIGKFLGFGVDGSGCF